MKERMTLPLELLFLTLEGIRLYSVHFHRILHKCSLYCEHVAVLCIILCLNLLIIHLLWPLNTSQIIHQSEKQRSHYYSSGKLECGDPQRQYCVFHCGFFLSSLQQPCQADLHVLALELNISVRCSSFLLLESSPPHSHPDPQLRSICHHRAFIHCCCYLS